ncbi:hypothetical protein LSTR_LSTR009642 [Laodelphax striatellus]|uniref:RPGR-interacting protein 1 first C2 domain-containing protein n=1 Tax=Laodelphax striatellus TaxID=195883 RepID=A0A482WPV4_LAOST|nr:hypothetical protein LSTR_LSTR009642 [Laodelphax striatellus]
MEPVNDRATQSTTNSSIDSQSSYKELLRNHGWSRKSHEFFRNPPKKSYYKEHQICRNNNRCTFTLWMKSIYFSSYTMERLNEIDVKPHIYLTWTFLELQDKAFLTILPSNKAKFNCSSVYKGDITRAMLRYMCSDRVRVECHGILNKSSQMISFGEIDPTDAFHHPNKKCKYKVCLDGPNNMTAVVSCWFKFDCPKTLRDVLKI